jgi:hypothetical protein
MRLKREAFHGNKLEKHRDYGFIAEDFYNNIFREEEGNEVCKFDFP